MATKKRGHGEGGIHQRADLRWEARLDLPNGKRKSLYGKTRREVQDKLRAAQRDIDNGIDLTTSKQTIARFLARWLDDVAKPRVRAKTYRSYEQLIRVHLSPGLG